MYLISDSNMLTKNICRAFGGLGSTLGPIFIQNLPGVDFIIPLTAIALGQLLVFMPTTLRKKLPLTYEDSANLKNESKLCCKTSE